VSGGKEKLEKMQLEAFLAYQAEAQRLEALDVVTDAQKAALEGLMMEYEATKKVKTNLVLDEVAGRLNKAKM
jgi:hypothetical protein